MNNEKKNHDEVSIIIDKTEYKSPNPTTGGALYILSKVDVVKYDLYKEVHGNKDDELVNNDNTEINLKNGDHFYSVQKSINPGS
jgi:hypothetical protein